MKLKSKNKKAEKKVVVKKSSLKTLPIKILQKKAIKNDVKLVLKKETNSVKKEVKTKIKVKEPKKLHALVKTEEAKNAIKEMILNPSVKLLKPFREAAKDNKRIIHEQRKKKNLTSNFLAKPVKNGKKYLLDLRVHSPGTAGYFFNAGIEPGPAIARLAEVKGLQMMGLAEYYNASFIDMVVSNNPCGNLKILPGVIVCSEIAGCKEVFLIVLFPETARSAEIYNFLDELEVPKSAYGKRDYCLPQEFGKILEIVEKHGAVAIPSRVDKTPYRQLAIAELVEKYGLRSFDLAHPDSPEYFKERWPDGGFTFFTFSSANALGQIGNRVEKVTLGELGFNGIKQIVSAKNTKIDDTVVN